MNIQLPNIRTQLDPPGSSDHEIDIPDTNITIHQVAQSTFEPSLSSEEPLTFEEMETTLEILPSNECLAVTMFSIFTATVTYLIHLLNE